jgi:hypothetical protein
LSLTSSKQYLPFNKFKENVVCAPVMCPILCLAHFALSSLGNLLSSMSDLLLKLH